MYGIDGRGGAQLAGIALERDLAVAQHDELRLVGLLRRGLLERQLAAAPERRVLGDVEGVAQLVGDDDRADAFEVAQLDDFLVHGDRRNRIEAGRRLVVEQDARLGRHRPGDGHAPPLAARQLGRLAVDEIGQADEAEDFLDAARWRRPSSSSAPRTACSRRSRGPSASRRAPLPGTPSRGRGGRASCRPRTCCPPARR